MSKSFIPKIKVKEGKSTGPLAILSAVIASSCCVLPVVLIVLGLGSLGAGAFLGKWAGVILTVAILLLFVSWWVYLRESRKLRAVALEMKNKRRTRVSLIVATVVIGGLTMLQGYSRVMAMWERAILARIETKGLSLSKPLVAEGLVRVTIPVTGMDCVTCEAPIERALRNCPGVKTADASIATNSVTVTFDPKKCSVERLVEVVNSTGYKAKLDEVTREGKR